MSLHAYKTDAWPMSLRIQYILRKGSLLKIWWLRLVILVYGMKKICWIRTITLVYGVLSGIWLIKLRMKALRLHFAERNISFLYCMLHLEVGKCQCFQFNVFDPKCLRNHLAHIMKANFCTLLKQSIPYSLVYDICNILKFMHLNILKLVFRSIN